jgi:hypothetical protein
MDVPQAAILYRRPGATGGASSMPGVAHDWAGKLIIRAASRHLQLTFRRCVASTATSSRFTSSVNINERNAFRDP